MKTIIAPSMCPSVSRMATRRFVDNTETSYQVGEFYTPGVEGGLMYNDPRLGLNWPLPVAVISDKDQTGRLLDRAWKPNSSRG